MYFKNNTTLFPFLFLGTVLPLPYYYPFQVLKKLSLLAAAYLNDLQSCSV